MSSSDLTWVDGRAAGLPSRAWAYVELTKPRIALFELMAVAVGATLGATVPTDGAFLLHLLLGTALVAGGASALNQWMERAIDARMARTVSRPLPSGRLTSREVFWFAVAASLTGVVYLSLAVSWVSAAVAAASWFLYVAAYTPLKSRTVLNTVVGAVAGALPFAIGWSAVGGPFNLVAVTSFTIIYLWQFPHFMAIAWLYREEYAAAGLVMWPSLDPAGTRAARLAVLAALCLLPVGLLPVTLGLESDYYLTGAVTLSVMYIAAAGAFFIRRNESSARTLLRMSLVYLPSLFGLMTLVRVA